MAVNAAVDVTEANAELSIPTNADRILFDSKSSKAAGAQFGGTGLSFDWQQSLPNKQDAMLAGGLDADNASDASKQGFYGLDFNSGLESAPGVKDHQLIQSTFAALRQY